MLGIFVCLACTHNLYLIMAGIVDAPPNGYGQGYNAFDSGTAGSAAAQIVAQACPEAAQRSLHLPLLHCNDKVLRILRFVESECEVLPSKERCPYLLVVELLEQPFTCKSNELFAQEQVAGSITFGPGSSPPGSPRLTGLGGSSPFSLEGGVGWREPHGPNHHQEYQVHFEHEHGHQHQQHQHLHQHSTLTINAHPAPAEQCAFSSVSTQKSQSYYAREIIDSSSSGSSLRQQQRDRHDYPQRSTTEPLTFTFLPTSGKCDNVGVFARPSLSEEESSHKSDNIGGDNGSYDQGSEGGAVKGPVEQQSRMCQQVTINNDTSAVGGASTGLSQSISDSDTGSSSTVSDKGEEAVAAETAAANVAAIEQLSPPDEPSNASHDSRKQLPRRSARRILGRELRGGGSVAEEEKEVSKGDRRGDGMRDGSEESSFGRKSIASDRLGSSWGENGDRDDNGCHYPAGSLYGGHTGGSGTNIYGTREYPPSGSSGTGSRDTPAYYNGAGSSYSSSGMGNGYDYGFSAGHSGYGVTSPSSYAPTAPSIPRKHFSLGKSWEDKKALVRSLSAFGHLQNWNLRSFIVKSGDDLRKEILAMQVIEFCQKIFQMEGLDIILRPYQIISTGYQAGSISFMVLERCICSLAV